MLPDLDRVDTPVHRIEPRLRVLQTVLLAAACAVMTRPAPLALLLAGAIALCLLARIPARVHLRRLLPLNAMLAVACAGLFLTEPAPGATDPAVRAMALVLKANTLLLALTALVGTLEPAALGDALERLRVPRAFTRLLLLTVRYVEVLRREMGRMRQAMRVRGFRPALDRRTLQCLGHLVGMLLVRAFDRADRVAMAMRCRGYAGHFPARPPRPLRVSEILDFVCANVLLAALAWGGWR